MTEKARRMTEVEWRLLDNLSKFWGAFCDADHFDGSDTFAERMEAAGYIHLRPVKRSDLDAAFAADRGIERGGNLWELTKKGRSALAYGEEPKR